MAIGKTLGDVRPQAGDILRLRVNQRKRPLDVVEAILFPHEMEVEVYEVLEGEDVQQLHAKCKVSGRRRIESFGQGTEVVESLW